jgi:hypothetical protein
MAREQKSWHHLLLETLQNLPQTWLKEKRRRGELDIREEIIIIRIISQMLSFVILTFSEY